MELTFFIFIISICILYFLSMSYIHKRVKFPVDNKGNKILLIDIDGTICEDIKNEDSHLYPTAKVFEDSRLIINRWYDERNKVFFFTARESKDRGVTEKWLQDNGFKYHGLIMDKPRIEKGKEYVWIDNRKVRAVTYLGNWSELREVYKRIQVFE